LGPDRNLFSNSCKFSSIRARAENYDIIVNATQGAATTNSDCLLQHSLDEHRQMLKLIQALTS